MLATGQQNIPLLGSQKLLSLPKNFLKYAMKISLKKPFALVEPELDSWTVFKWLLRGVVSGLCVFLVAAPWLRSSLFLHPFKRRFDWQSEMDCYLLCESRAFVTMGEVTFLFLTVVILQAYVAYMVVFPYFPLLSVLCLIFLKTWMWIFALIFVWAHHFLLNFFASCTFN